MISPNIVFINVKIQEPCFSLLSSYSAAPLKQIIWVLKSRTQPLKYFFKCSTLFFSSNFDVEKYTISISSIQTTFQRYQNNWIFIKPIVNIVLTLHCFLILDDDMMKMISKSRKNMWCNWVPAHHAHRLLFTLSRYRNYIEDAASTDQNIINDNRMEWTVRPFLC